MVAEGGFAPHNVEAGELGLQQCGVAKVCRSRLG